MYDTVICTEALTRDFGATRALSMLSMEAADETVLVLLGPNGAGKTTLMRLLMGLIEPTAGRARVLGADPRAMPAGLAGSVAYVGDRCEPPGWATAALLEDMQAGASPAFDRAYFHDLCSQRNLERKRRYASLSKGRRRWLLTALALAARPRVMLLDEPSDGLDPAARRALYDAVREHVTENGATAIVTTHVIADVERIADDVAIIERGRLLLHAALEDLRDRMRQVELPAGETHEGALAPCTVLGRTLRDDTKVFWIDRESLTDDDLRARIGATGVVRHTDLETLYLAAVEHRDPTGQTQVKETGT